MDASFQAPERNGFRYPLFRRNDRPLPAEWEGSLYVWDIDNTYLITEWKGLRDLLRIRFEDALDKRPVPGAVPLLRGLGDSEQDPERRPAIHFVSASPHTMREVLERRMLIDGVVHDGISFRDWGALRYLRDVFGYKIVALLLLRRETPPGAREVLFGDDREHDPWVYSLYSRICAGELRGEELREVLESQRVRSAAAAYAVALADELPRRDPVDWIFIRRLRKKKATSSPAEGAEGEGEEPASERRRRRSTTRRRRRPKPPGQLDARLVEVEDYGQAAAVLFAAGRLRAEDLRAVVAEVAAAGDSHPPLAALERLGAFGADDLERARAALAEDPGEAPQEEAE
ncbi:MAG TPA: hypothetical protein DEA08_32515 [Planctomycetes bacterium]|nr:hypothetical protein [Planctomycetota bacterium]